MAGRNYSAGDTTTAPLPVPEDRELRSHILRQEWHTNILSVGAWDDLTGLGMARLDCDLFHTTGFGAIHSHYQHLALNMVADVWPTAAYEEEAMDGWLKRGALLSEWGSAMVDKVDQAPNWFAVVVMIFHGRDWYCGGCSYCFCCTPLFICPNMMMISEMFIHCNCIPSCLFLWTVHQPIAVVVKFSVMRLLTIYQIFKSTMIAV